MFKKDPETGCPSMDGFYLSCGCVKDIRVSCIDQEALASLMLTTYKYLIRDRIQGLMQEKARVLHEYGLWPWNKKSNQMHREINSKLEVLGAYQGKYD